MYKWWFSLAFVAVSYAGFGRGTGQILLDDLRCTGTESSLLSCSHSGIGVTYCSHSNDAGVVCPTCKLHVYTSALRCNCNSVYLVVKHMCYSWWNYHIHVLFKCINLQVLICYWALVCMQSVHSWMHVAVRHSFLYVLNIVWLVLPTVHIMGMLELCANHVSYI